MTSLTPPNAPPAPAQTKPPTLPPSPLAPLDTFPRRHIGPSDTDIAALLHTIGADSLDTLTDQTVPPSIRLKHPLNLPAALTESEALAELRTIASKNKVYKSFIGMGYYDTITPPVILRNILENPGWYTQYTPYQAEIAQGRLEALLNFQTMVSDLTALPMANASMLDEATAAAEAMNMCHSIKSDEPGRNTFFVSENCHPQTIAVIKTRAKWLGIDIVVGDEGDLFHDSLALPVGPKSLCGILVQYPGTDGRIENYDDLTEQAHNDGILIVAATDLLALTLIKPPGEWGTGGAGGGADIAVGNTQRFGVPMGFGGPHAAFMACKTEFTRKLPGRIVGISKDTHGNPAYRLALQTREQHIRREKATSNICTAQVLLAIMASMYAVYHGPEGLKAIARRVHCLIQSSKQALKNWGYDVGEGASFDTICIHLDEKRAGKLRDYLKYEPTLPPKARENPWGQEENKFRGKNVRFFGDGRVGISFDETTTLADAQEIISFLHVGKETWFLSKEVESLTESKGTLDNLARKSAFLTHPVFNSYHSEHEMLRYIHRLQAKDLSLTTSMIPLGSCTMKLNATAEMIPVSWPEFSKMHPFAPADQTLGYQELFQTLEAYLAEITGFDAVSLQPNAGSQGEYAGLLAIRAYHEANEKRETRNAKRETDGTPTQSSVLSPQSSPSSARDICLIPTSAHGTNPASAVVAGLKVIPVACDSQGNVDLADLKKKAAEHEKHLACIMITYPSTHGVFEESVKEICQIVHTHGGQVYMDGANMNAQVGLTSPGEIGADVCHLNLHKTFCIPHGGGGPGMGPIAVAKHLAPYLPRHPLSGESLDNAERQTPNAERSVQRSTSDVQPSSPLVVSAAPYGSASILPISWMYIRMMGEPGLTRATQAAILNANYMAKRLETHYPILFRGKNGRCAHEFILDCRQFEESAGVKVEDIAKRLMDYGFHAPTMSWPVPGTLMFEPTESESKAELDRMCEAMIHIRGEIRAIEDSRADRTDNPLKHAPHTALAVTADDWTHKYPRRQAAYPAPWMTAGSNKFWPTVGRIDNPYGDRNLICTCPPMEESETRP